MDDNLTKGELIFFTIGDILVALFGVITALFIYFTKDCVNSGAVLWAFVMGIFFAQNTADAIKNITRIIHHNYKEKE